MPPVIDRGKCTRCGYCAQICPLDVMKLENSESGTEVVVKYPDECWHCRACEKDCPAGAIHMRYPLSHLILHMQPDGGK